MNMEDTPDAENLLANPFYTVVFTSRLFEEQPEMAHEDWVLLNAHLIEDISSKVWLEELLNVISLPSAKYEGHDIINPCLAVKVSNRLQGEHPLLVTHEQWVQANIKLMDELGSAKWLERLLGVLETGEPEAA
jgi:hypothetical protein